VKTIKRFWLYLPQFFLEWEMFQTTVVERIKKKHFMHDKCFSKMVHLWDNVENTAQPKKWRQQERLHDAMSQQKTDLNFIFTYLFNVIRIPYSFLLPTTVIFYYYTKLGFAFLHISATYFS